MTEPARMPRGYWYSQVAVWVSLVALVVGGAIYTNHAVAAEDAKVRQAIAAEGRIQCAIYTLLDNVYKTTPPTTPTGRNFAAAVHKVVLDLGC